MRRNFLPILLLLVTAPACGHAATTPDAAQAPRIDKLIPDSIDACSLQDGKALLVLGEFPVGTRILLDGAGVAAAKVGKKEIVVTVPVLENGMHRVEAVAAGGRRSLPQALVVDSVPFITSLAPGEDRVTAYEVIVRGVNFFFESTLVVNGAALRPARTMADPKVGQPLVGGRDYVRYEDCSTLVYVRHPVTREPGPVTLRVVNPGGEQSPEYEMEIP